MNAHGSWLLRRARACFHCVGPFLDSCHRGCCQRACRHFGRRKAAPRDDILLRAFSIVMLIFHAAPPTSRHAMMGRDSHDAAERCYIHDRGRLRRRCSHATMMMTLAGAHGPRDAYATRELLASIAASTRRTKISRRDISAG